MAERTLRVCALYPELMNIYADRGNLLVLEHRCAWRGIGFELSAATLGDPLDPEAHDLIYLGGGQDRDQRLVARDLVETKRDALHAAAARGAIVLGVCGGYQLLGGSYALGGEELPGVGLVDARTVREEGPRLIGDVAIEVDLGEVGQSPTGQGRPEGDRPSRDAGRDAPRSRPVVVAGFENHGGRTYLGAGEQPLGRVLRGNGNNGRDRGEGVRRGTVIGTYLHGPLLPKNAHVADWLIATATGMTDLAPLDDALERAAHAEAERAAGLDPRPARHR